MYRQYRRIPVHATNPPTAHGRLRSIVPTFEEFERFIVTFGGKEGGKGRGERKGTNLKTFNIRGVKLYY
jgi:hypothetical protein